MKIIYTKHAELKLKRLDIKKFKINKKLIQKILAKPEFLTITQYDDSAAIGFLDEKHILRIIYVTINTTFKVITFHIARRSRYET